MIRAAFWVSFLFIVYTYAGYPALLHCWSFLLPRRVRKKPLEPAPLVSVVIAARNEERNIARRIENLFNQDYPGDRMEIIIISDGSTDATDSIVASLVEGRGRAAPALRHIALEGNRGKPGALNAGVAAAAGEYIVFADARQQFEPDAISRLLENFGDPDVGAVSGELVFHEDSETAIRTDMGLYWNLEKWIRKAESRIHSTAGATGAIYAARKELLSPLPPKVILDDVMIPMRIVLRGYRTVFESGAIAWDTVSVDHTQEKRRKVRTLFGNYQLVHLMPGLLSPRKNPIFLQFLSHKIFRLFVPFFFVLMMASALAAGSAAYTLFFAAAMAAVLLPLIEKPLARIPLMRKASSFSRTFTSLNYFAFLAFLVLVKPGRKEIW
ncbi:MAG: glycosyltransferase family 2 protein [Candidatus Krumholzibacteria bacterium]|jgi:cellulose synthase/poly-beta-1,6-N-acetylglucosamine synthase-like glycosyltransferase|nr:glycosyltransferase family 2 protein [Candidatus Krumholzibacteria bacterium]